MDKSKQLELVRKRNSELSKTIDELKSKIDFDSKNKQESFVRAKELIKELEEIKEEWESSLKILKEKQEEYELLISDLKKMSEIMHEPINRAK
ncbi:MAG: hypothetical protein LUG91_00125 [Ruminococcus sp.]|nr:hypothetical protein [Ruminococcus sp.]